MTSRVCIVGEHVTRGVARNANGDNARDTMIQCRLLLGFRLQT